MVLGLQFQAELLFRILVSVLLGFIIGFERKLRLKEAGIRTHTIVCIGSTLMMLISLYAFGTGADTARVAAQIVAGVGFLGAGMIVFKKHEVHGLTTAAGIWATAGIGMACGAGLYVLAGGTTIALVLVQFICHSKIKIFHAKRIYSINIEFIKTKDQDLIIKELFGTEHFKQLRINRVDGNVVYTAMLETDKEFSS